MGQEEITHGVSTDEGSLRTKKTPKYLGIQMRDQQQRTQKEQPVRKQGEPEQSCSRRDPRFGKGGAGSAKGCRCSEGRPLSFMRGDSRTGWATGDPGASLRNDRDLLKWVVLRTWALGKESDGREEYKE